MREILHSDAIPGPKFRYSQCVKAGPFYQIAGMVGLDGITGALVQGGPKVETKQILENLQIAMKDFSLQLDQLFSARVYTTEFDRFAEINESWNEVFADTAPPARSAVGVSALPLGASVEIEFCFYKP